MVTVYSVRHRRRPRAGPQLPGKRRGVAGAPSPSNCPGDPGTGKCVQGMLDGGR